MDLRMEMGDSCRNAANVNKSTANVSVNEGMRG